MRVLSHAELQSSGHFVWDMPGKTHKSLIQTISGGSVRCELLMFPMLIIDITVVQHSIDSE